MRYASKVKSDRPLQLHGVPIDSVESKGLMTWMELR